MAKNDKQKGQKGPKIKVTNSDPKRLVKEEPDEQPEVDTDDVQDDQADEGSDNDQSAEVADLKQQVLRVHADFDNFKRRTQEERAEVFDTARAEMALKLMPVIDNFDRAAEHVPEEIQKDPWYQGIEGIRKQFTDLLTELGIERIESVGEEFDPNRHEAISHEPSDEHDKDIISKEFEAGYALGDSVIRPAKVNVSSGKEKA
jgi:molecular chaperone GrpE